MTVENAPEKSVDAVPDSHPAGGPAKGRKPRQRIRWEQYGTILFFFAFFAFVGVMEGSTFLSWNNVFTALAQNGYLTFVAVAATIVLINGQFDLSLGAMAGFAAVLTAGLTSMQALPIWLAILVTVGIGCLLGLVNGFLVTKLKINVFIATLGTSGVVAGAALIYAEGQIIYDGIPESLTDFGVSKGPGGLPNIIWLPLILGAVMWFVTKKTVLGRYWYAVGSNAESSRLAGINVNRMVLLSLVFAGGLAALGGIMFSTRFGSVDPSIGPGFLLPAYAAAFLGSSILSDGRFSVVGTIIATFLVAFAQSGLLIMGLNFAAQIFNGIVLVAAVAINEELRRRVKKVVRKPA